MARIALRQMLHHAAESGYGVPAYNVDNLEPVQAIMSAPRFRPALEAARIAAQGICAQRFEAFGCARMAPKIRPLALEKMAPKHR